MRTHYDKLFTSIFLLLLLVQLFPPGTTIASRFSDFPIRDRLISFVTGLRLKLGDRVFHDVIVDRHWLVYATDGAMDKFQNVDLLEESELLAYGNAVKEFGAFVEENGAKLYFVAAPYKNTIYPEYVPTGIPKIGTTSRYDQIIDQISKQQTFRVLDLRPALLMGKEKSQIYYSTDTHWNDIGGYFAYQAIMNALLEDFPELSPHPLTDFKITTQSPKIMDLSYIIGADGLAEERIQLQFRFRKSARLNSVVLPSGRQINLSHNVNQDLPVALFLHDSFLYTIMPLLSEHFSTTYFVDLMAGNDMLPREWVDQIRPDVVIILINEHFIDLLPQLIEKGRLETE